MPKQYEAEIVAGLESFAIAELGERLGGGDIEFTRPGFVRFGYGGAPSKFSALRSVIAVYQIHQFAIPRPKALLGHQHFTRLIKILLAAAGSMLEPPLTFGIGAAGSGSSVLRRLRDEIAEALKLPESPDGKGDLYLRLLRRPGAAGWEALVRTSATPMSKRAYRIVDVPGALNSTVAYAMTKPDASQKRATVVNLCSGSSTILIEHALSHFGDRLLGIECSRAALAAGARNAEASGAAPAILHLLADATETPLPADSVDRLYADLPFGNLVGTHDANIRLYPRVLREAARIARANAVFIVLTHEIKLLRRCLLDSPWSISSETQINLRGLHPRLFVLWRNSTRIEKENQADH